MLFNSPEFVVFLLLFCGLYFPLRSRFRAQNLLIVAGSYLFYGWWDVRFLQLILISTALDFMSALMIERDAACCETLRQNGLHAQCRDVAEINYKP